MGGGRRDRQRPGCGSFVSLGRSLDLIPRGVGGRGGERPLFQPAWPQWPSNLYLPPSSVFGRPHLGSTSSALYSISVSGVTPQVTYTGSLPDPASPPHHHGSVPAEQLPTWSVWLQPTGPHPVLSLVPEDSVNPLAPPRVFAANRAETKLGHSRRSPQQAGPSFLLVLPALGPRAAPRWTGHSCPGSSAFPCPPRLAFLRSSPARSAHPAGPRPRPPPP